MVEDVCRETARALVVELHAAREAVKRVEETRTMFDFTSGRTQIRRIFESFRNHLIRRRIGNGTFYKTEAGTKS